VKFSYLTFQLTEDCNWNCSFCYQRKGRRYLDQGLLREACRYFYPFLAEDATICFWGGEPLLGLDSIRLAVESFEARRGPRYSLTTNGSLLTGEALRFFDAHGFEILLSFDVPSAGRPSEGHLRQSLAVLDRLLEFPRLHTMTNNVFTPRTVHRLSASARILAEKGVSDVYLSPANNVAWDSPSLARLKEELDHLRPWLVSFYGKTGTVPVVDFREGGAGGTFVCLAGRDRMCLAADGSLWGCPMFLDYFRARRDPEGEASFGFGPLKDFIRSPARDYRRILRNHDLLHMEYFRAPKSPCQLCWALDQCHICPVLAAFSSGEIGRISASSCRISRLWMAQRELFWEEVRRARGSASPASARRASPTSGRPGSAALHISRNRP
jgi:sulfatase maturation enzyme AslB (radical SAM superfamily)